jgi:molecular chaperone DnaK
MKNGEIMSENQDLRFKKITFGIDLGTHNAAIAQCAENHAIIIPNLITQEKHTPSAVTVYEDGNVVVGQPAKRQVLFNPMNAASEFKTAIGSSEEYLFKDSSTCMTAEEMTAEVLKELKKSAEIQTGEKINSAVITVPTDFSPIQINATKRAAELAGFKFTRMIPDCIAAAYAYSKAGNNGIWLIYDFGGGTFDASVVKSDDGNIINLANSADGNLGGNLIDWDIVYKIFAKKISDDLYLTDFNRKNKDKYLKQIARLKNAAEEAKIELSKSDSTIISIKNLFIIKENDYDFEYVLKKEELEEIMNPYIKRTLNHCRNALKKANLTPEYIDYIIPVGGSALSPAVRESLKETFDIPLKDDIDPTDVVAKGAAQFAKTLPDPVIHPSEYFALQLDYESIGPIDEEFIVFGKVSSQNVDDYEGFRIEAINIETKRNTGLIPVEPDGYFELELMAEDTANIYSIRLYDGKGRLRMIDRDSANAIEYSEGTVEMILSHTLAMGLYDDSMFVFAQEGSSLPYHNMEILRVTSDVIKGDESTQISLHLYYGTAEAASHNEKIAELSIDGLKIDETLKAGSEIELIVDIDLDQVMKFEVLVPETGQKIPFEIYPHEQEISLDEIRDKFNKSKSKYSQIHRERHYEEIYDEVEEYLNQIEEENLIESIADFIESAETDKNAIRQANKLINQLDEILYSLNRYIIKTIFGDDIEEHKEEIRELVEEYGTDEDKAEFENISQELYEAIENYNPTKKEQKLNSLLELEAKCNRQKDIKRILIYLILFEEDYYEKDIDLVNELKEKGKIALDNDDFDELVNIGSQLVDLLQEPIPILPPQPFIRN